jgi:general secretion pathway protein D
MFELRSRVALLTLFAFVSVAALAQQPTQVSPQSQTPAVTTTQPQLPPEVAAEREEFRRRDAASIPIEDLIAEVARNSDKEFLVDPRVRAHVFAVPALEDPTYETLLSVLRMHGYMAVEIGGKVNILPDANARSMPTRLLQRDDNNVPDDEVITRVITVPGNNAANLVPILRPLLPQSAHLAALVTDQASNKLIVVDTYANVRRITELIETLGQ